MGTIGIGNIMRKPITFPSGLTLTPDPNNPHKYKVTKEGKDWDIQQAVQNWLKGPEDR